MADEIPSQKDVVDMIVPILKERGGAYRKTKQAFLKKAVAGEKIQTILNGKVETENVANEGDWIVRADTTMKERYILSSDTVLKCYESESPLDITDHPDAEELNAEGFKAYVSTRRCLAVKVDEDIMSKFPAGKFMAAWGEPMLVEAGDFLASGPPTEDGTINEIVRIEKEAFAQTFAPDLDSA